MAYIQFYTLSTGYIKNTIPPQFNGPRYPIQALGSDGIARLDGRLGYFRASLLAENTARKRKYIGYSIEKSSIGAGPHGKIVLI